MNFLATKLQRLSSTHKPMLIAWNLATPIEETNSLMSLGAKGKDWMVRNMLYWSRSKQKTKEVAFVLLVILQKNHVPC